MGEGREGDWECRGCQNRNYAFRSFCNRCKQPRLLVGSKTPADSKWLPRIGDWICSGCSNNNYASRDICKKCGQAKEEAAIPAVAMPGASLPTYAHYFARAHGLHGFDLNFGFTGNSALQPSALPNSSRWPYGAVEKYGIHPGSWLLNGSSSSGFSYANHKFFPAMVPKDWRDGDWMCNCGFHNYSSRAQCKKCNAPSLLGAPSSAANSGVSDIFPSLGTKRLASEEFSHDYDSKRLNSGDMSNILGFEQLNGSHNGEAQVTYSRYSNGSSAVMSSPQLQTRSAHMSPVPMIVGKGAKHWRDGDWMCSNCNNHNYASRTCCNRCKFQREETGVSPC